MRKPQGPDKDKNYTEYLEFAKKENLETQLEKVSSELRNTKSELEKVSSKWTVTTSELVRVSSELENTKSELEKVSSKWTVTTSELKIVSSELKELKNRQNLYSKNRFQSNKVFIMSICLMIILNICTIWLVIFKSDFTGILPWYYIVIITLANIVYSNWIHYSHDYFGIYEYFLEIGILVMNLTFIWISAFFPVEEITVKVIVFLIFLSLGNLLMISTKILYFILNSSRDFSLKKDLDFYQKPITLSINIIGSVFLVCIIVFFCFFGIW